MLFYYGFCVTYNNIKADSTPFLFILNNFMLVLYLTVTVMQLISLLASMQATFYRRNRMKKVISVFVALVLILALYSCSGKTDTASETPSAATTSSTDSTEAEASSETSETSEEPTESEAVDPSLNRDEVGFFAPDVDPQSRDTYNIIHMYPYTLLLFELMTECFNVYAEELNCTITPSTTESDMDMFVQNIELYAGQGNVDGIIVIIDPPTAVRIKEVLDESGIPYIAWCNSVRDENGSEIVPSVGLDQYSAAQTTVQWLYDNYSTYWGDIDTSKIALMNINASISADLNDRAVGAEDKFNELIPDNAGVFNVDMVADFTQEGAYNQASATFSGNPDIEYWFVTNVVEMYSQGAARAVEAMQKEDSVLITDVGSDILCSEWETGYDGPWVSCLAISNYLYAAPAICGLVSLIDGTSTWDTLWSDLRAPGDMYTFYGAESAMITKDTYKDYFNTYAEMAGGPIPYPAS